MLDQKLLAGDAEGVGAYLDHWARLQLAGGSCDRAAAAAAVRLAYAAATAAAPCNTRRRVNRFPTMPFPSVFYVIIR